ncbi:MAG: LacI family DNA-binding transcriptional regulator [Bryobacteraceae bacterium]
MKTRQVGDKAESSGSIGIKEIAKALDVSIGTVDRALHARPGINPMTRAKVLKMAQTMGYRPNLAARFLKSRRSLVFSVQLPAKIASFFDPLRAGIREAAAPLGPTVQLQFRTYPALGEGDAELFDQALHDGVQGIIITPGEPSMLKAHIRKAARRNIPVVCVASDAPGTERLTAVSACPYTNGAVAAELLSRIIHQRGKLAIVTGSLATEDHAEKVDGFRTTLAAAGAPLALASIIEAHDDEAAAYAATKALLASTPSLRGIYVSTANCLTVLQAIEDAGLGGKLVVITTDLFPEQVPLIRSGRVFATIHQRPVAQGRMAFEALHQFLVEGRCPPAKIRLAPHIVMNSNLDLFLGRLSLEEERPPVASVAALAGKRKN